MTTWAYTAVEPNGQRKTGFIDAANREAAMQAISASGRFVLEIKEGKSRPTEATKGETKRKGKASKADVALFSRRMADLAIAGLPLDRVLQIVAEQSESASLAEVAEKALEEVRGGKPVSEALAAFPQYFPQVYTQTLRSGEASGQFGEVTGRLAEFQRKDVEQRTQIVSALVYPGILSMTAVFVVIFLLTFVVPKLSPVFEGLGDQLPESTKLLLAFSGALTNQWYVVLGSLIVAGIFYKLWVATEAGAFARDRAMMTMPIIGPVVRKATISRFARVLGTLVFGGVPILEGLELAGLASGNRVFIKSAQQVEGEVREGRGIAEAMRDTGAFPAVLTHMVAIGEETGDLPKMLSRVSDSLDFEVDNGMKRLTTLIEPLIILTMAGFVGFVVISVVLPIYQAGDLVK